MPVLRRDCYHKLPEIVQEAVRMFSAKSVSWPTQPYVLPPAVSCPSETNDIPDYIAYCKRMMGEKKVDRHIAKTLIEGLEICGDEGKNLIEKLKRIRQ
jgi:hypothetical protein